MTPKWRKFVFHAFSTFLGFRKTKLKLPPVRDPDRILVHFKMYFLESENVQNDTQGQAQKCINLLSMFPCVLTKWLDPQHAPGSKISMEEYPNINCRLKNIRHTGSLAGTGAYAISGFSAVTIKVLVYLVVRNQKWNNFFFAFSPASSPNSRIRSCTRPLMVPLYRVSR